MQVLLLCLMSFASVIQEPASYSVTIVASAAISNEHGEQQRVDGDIRSTAFCEQREEELVVRFEHTETRPRNSEQWIAQPDLSEFIATLHTTSAIPVRCIDDVGVAATAQTNASLLTTAIQAHHIRTSREPKKVVDTVSIMGLHICTHDSISWGEKRGFDSLQERYTWVEWSLSTTNSRVLPNEALETSPVTLNVDLVRSIKGRTLFDNNQNPLKTQLAGSESWDMSFAMADGSTMSGATAITTFSMTIVQNLNPHED